MTTDADELDSILEQSEVCSIILTITIRWLVQSGIDYERFEEKMRNPYKKHTI